jgi:hypothetical protein
MKKPAPSGVDAGRFPKDPLSISHKELPAALINFIAALYALSPATWAAVQDIERRGLKRTDVNGMIAAAKRHGAQWQAVLARFGWLPTQDGRGLTNPLMGPARFSPPAPLDPECQAAFDLGSL